MIFSANIYLLSPDFQPTPKVQSAGSTHWLTLSEGSVEFLTIFCKSPAHAEALAKAFCWTEPEVESVPDSMSELLNDEIPY